MAGDADAWGDGGGGAEAFDVADDGRRRVEDCLIAQGRFVSADPLGVPAAECVVGERAAPALSVMDDGNFEQRSVRKCALGELADERDIVDHLRGDASADVADHDRVAEAESEKVRGVDTWVQAGDHKQLQVGEDDGALVAPVAANA